jgi:glutamyl/glutaminyl-tRNA synthetase
VTKGIIVNTIHCGGERDGIDGHWKDGAVLADGRYLNIDQNRQVVHIPAPQDKEIAELGARLNRTYIPYGQRGQVAQERQAAQDTNASLASPQAVVQRTLTKSSHNYLNTGWDLVDGLQAGSMDLSKIKDEDLPKDMKGMNGEQRVNYVNAKGKERAELQAKVQQLNEQRNKYIAEQAAKQQGDQTLGSAVKQAIREQAGKKHYTFKPVQAPSDANQVTPKN